MFRNKRTIEFKMLAEHVFNTEQGQQLLKYLQEDYVDVSPIAETVEMTFYNVAKQDLIKDLISFVKDKNLLDDIETVDYQTEE